jgi:hypothetical protein
MHGQKVSPRAPLCGWDSPRHGLLKWRGAGGYSTVLETVKGPEWTHVATLSSIHAKLSGCGGVTFRALRTNGRILIIKSATVFKRRGFEIAIALMVPCKNSFFDVCVLCTSIIVEEPALTFFKSECWSPALALFQLISNLIYISRLNNVKFFFDPFLFQ